MSATPARALAFELLRATFEREAHTELAFREAADERGLAGRERAQAQRLAYGAVQRRGTTDAATERLAERSTRLLDPPVLAGLRLGLYELLFADATPDHAAVDQAVELVKAAGAAHAAGLVNAVLRRAARERSTLLAGLTGDDSTPELAAVAHSAPLWLARMWWEQLGAADARALLAACNEPAELGFRVNTLRAGVDATVARLREAGVEAAPAVPFPHMGGERNSGTGGRLAVAEAVTVSGRTGGVVPQLVAEGILTPQSRGSAAVVEVLDPRPGEHVLDLCAGPGIKTGQIATRMGDRGEAISVELDPARAAEVAAQAERLGLRGVSVIEADATNPGMTGFDRVLVDAPCSDLGALASRPDARWRKSPRAIERLAELQGRILARAAEALRPGGTLVYSTCTISRCENEDRVAALLESGEGTGLRVDFQTQLRPDRDRTTGFFVCRMRKDGDL
ncbi:MAG TPA: transcription antitermination factor NusB [Solirubrobacterales bacterium]|nr:transcription antitermination factor NusB [Solirubrobacterales bacterium]